MSETVDGPVLIYSTFPDLGTAKRAAAGLVEHRLAACVNILPEMVSIYRWEGEIEEDTEVVLIAKTRRALVEPATAEISGSHPYDLPAILALPIEGGSVPFCDWIMAESVGDT